MPVPDEPKADEITRYVLATYAGIARARRYLQMDMGGKPLMLPLTARDVDDWLTGHPSPLERDELDACVFELDAMERAQGG